MTPHCKFRGDSESAKSVREGLPCVLQSGPSSLEWMVGRQNQTIGQFLTVKNRRTARWPANPWNSFTLHGLKLQNLVGLMESK
jgi:hypothetical protein